MTINLSIKKIWIFILFNLIFFQVPLMEYINDKFTYIDEFVAILSIFELIKTCRYKWDKFSIKFVLVLCFYTMFGVFGNISAGIVTDFKIIIQGILLFLRNFIIFLGTYRASKSLKIEIKKMIPIFIKEIKIMVLLALMIWPLSQLFDIGMTYDIRFGLKSYAFIFHHPGNFATYLLFSLLFLTFFDKKRKENRYFYIGITLFLLLTTLRYSYIIAFGIYMFYMIYKNDRINKFIKLAGFIVGIISVSILAFPQFSKYFLQGDTPRLLFYKYALVTFLEYPFGTGFGTFGSYMAQVYYSPLYMKYGFYLYYGMSPESSLFLFDNFWPMIIVESGILGTICIIGLFALLFNKANKNKDFLSQIIIMVLLVFTIIGQTAIHFSSVIFYIISGLTLSHALKPIERSKK